MYILWYENFKNIDLAEFYLIQNNVKSKKGHKKCNKNMSLIVLI